MSTTFLPTTIEEKFVYLQELILTTAEKFLPRVSKKRFRINCIRTIQIIIATLTTILLGLNLGDKAISLAFILSTLTTAITVWYNIEGNSKKYSSMYRYSVNLTSLAREINFYITCMKPMTEEKFDEFSNRFFSMKEMFEKECIDLTNESLKREQEQIYNLTRK